MARHALDFVPLLLVIVPIAHAALRPPKS